MMERFSRLLRDSRGGTAIEYGLIASLVIIAILAAVIALAGTTIDMWNNVSDEVINA